MSTYQLHGRQRAQRIRVLKFGGTSVGTTPERLRRVAEKAADARAEGCAVVAVVSARGKTTDHLLEEAQQAGACPPTREIDQLLATGEVQSAALLAIALNDLGVPAVSLLGSQAGISVIGAHGEGRIEDISTTRLHEILDHHAVAVVAGFQGVNARSDTVTLGRGGSDTSAVALAIALGAERCEIYTDVDGVYTADPRSVPSARTIPLISNNQMAELAFAGARILHSRSVELAGRAEMDIKVLSSFTDDRGTTVAGDRKSTEMFEHCSLVTAIAHDTDSARVVVDEGTAEADLFAILAEASITIDVVSSVRSGWEFTVPRGQAATVRRALARYPAAVHIDLAVSKVSLVGQGMLSSSDSVAGTLSSLSACGIRPLSVSVSQNRIALVVPEAQCIQAVSILHERFFLEESGLLAAGEPAVA